MERLLIRADPMPPITLTRARDAKLLDRMVEMVRKGDIAHFIRRAHDVEPADLADVLSALDERERVAVVQALPPELSSQALAEMPGDSHVGETLAALDPDRPPRSSASSTTTTRPTSWVSWTRPARRRSSPVS